jgi:3-oxoacyl-[acyl-carrier protein] reductase
MALMAEELQLNGKTAVVTGAATGIGAAIAQMFAAQGARVVLADRDAGRLRATAAVIGPNAIPIVGDVGDTRSVAALAEAALASGPVDILVNNAGIYPRRAFLEMTEDDWDTIHNINLKGVFRCCRAFLPSMAARGSGKIVNISSVTFHLGMANLVHYVASKGGIIGLTRSLAREFGPSGIHVNCITPGAVLVEHEKEVTTEDDRRYFVAQQCLPRRILPLDIARAALFLATPLSDGMTGQTLNVDGGWHMH